MPRRANTTGTPSTTFSILRLREVANATSQFSATSVVAMIAANRQTQGITPRQIADEEIVQRLVFSLVNEAAHILEEGIATKASDIDVVYIFGYGFPVHRGGPLCYANEVGLFNVVAAMQRFANNPLDDAAFWQPAPLLQRLVAEGKSF